MRFAVNLAPFGAAADVRLLVQMAREAEEAGWDGFFLWDHMNWDEFGPEIADPWIALTAIACATERIAIGPMVTPVFRRRPAKLARETATLQNLSGGRLILGVGLGSPDPEESMYLGEEGRLSERAAITDEALELLDKLWSGAPVVHRGRYFKLRSKGFRPAPCQPIPVWVAATWPFHKGPLARAQRHQGVVAACYTGEPIGAEQLQLLSDCGTVVYGIATGDDPQADSENVKAFRQAGVDWWLEPLDPWRAPLEVLRQRILAGPPA